MHLSHDTDPASPLVVTNRDIGSDFSAHEDKKLSPNRPRLLLVEDHPHILHINSALLDMLGCDITAASNGAEALALGVRDYDIIILDITLPDITGIEIARALRQLNRHHQTPMIALTMLGNEVDDACYRAGINEVARKPMLIDGLCSLLVRQLPQHKRYLTKQWEEVRK